MEKFNNDFIQYSDDKVKNETKHLTLYFILHISLYIVLIFFLIFFAWYTVFVSTHKFYAVKGVSMMSTLNSEITAEQLEDVNKAQTLSYDAVYVDKTTAPRIFDIIVVEKPNSDSVIKRLMGMEGDYISIAKGVDETGAERFYFYRIASGTDLTGFKDEDARLEERGENGYQIYNPQSLWIHHSTSGSKARAISVDAGGETLTNEYEYTFYTTFLREFENNGFNNENLKYNYFVSDGGMIYVQVPKNSVFYLGDNRAYSSDCRERGFCDKKYVVGRSEFIVYNYNFGNRLWEVVKFYFSRMEIFFAR